MVINLEREIVLIALSLDPYLCLQGMSLSFLFHVEILMRCQTPMTQFLGMDFSVFDSQYLEEGEKRKAGMLEIEISHT